MSHLSTQQQPSIQVESVSESFDLHLVLHLQQSQLEVERLDKTESTEAVHGSGGRQAVRDQRDEENQLIEVSVVSAGDSKADTGRHFGLSARTSKAAQK